MIIGILLSLSIIGCLVGVGIAMLGGDTYQVNRMENLGHKILAISFASGIITLTIATLFDIAF